MIKKILFAFIFSLLVLISPQKTYALSSNSGVAEFYINNTNFINSNSSLYYTNTNYISLNTYVNLYSGYSYKYYVIYFATTPDSSLNPLYRFGISLAGGCTYSCFSSNSYIKNLGVIQGLDYYAAVLQLGKMDCGVGSGQCILSNYVNISSLTNTTITIIGVDALNDDTLVNNNYANFQLLMKNQNNNTDSIINNNNNNTNTIINNNNNNQQQTNQKLDNVNNSLNDDTGVPHSDVGDKVNEWNSLNANSGPVSGMVLMPITLLNAYVNGFGSSSTCSPYNLGNLFGTDIVFPCINIGNYIGSTLWNVIDVLFSGFMIYAMGKRFVRMFNDFTNLKDNQIDDLYGGGK